MTILPNSEVDSVSSKPSSPASNVVTVLGQPAGLREADLLPPDQPLKPYPPLKRWRYNAGVRLAIFLASFAVISFGLGMVAGVALVAGGASSEDLFRVFSDWGNILAIPVSLLAYWLLVRVVEQRRPAYEFSARRLPRGVLLVGLALGTIFILASVGVLALFGAYRVEGFNPSYSPWGAILSAGFGAAIVEEIVFRGVLFRLFEDTFGTWIAVAVSGLVFGFAHITNPQATLQGAVAIALEAGVLFAALYAFTRNLWLVMGVHFAWNVVQGPVLGIVLSGTSARGAGFVESTLAGPEWLSGGQFGMEASLVTIVLLTAIGVWLLVEIARRGLVVQPSWVRRRALLARVDAGGEDAAPMQPGA